MIVEEKKAGEKECAAAHNNGYCVGSRCMAWRWNTEQNPDYKPPFDGTPWRLSTTHGFCGLAGRL